VTYWLMRWLDRRWFRWHARGALRHDWLDRRPKLWTFTGVPASTWLRKPRTGWESYRAHLGPLLLEREMWQLISENTEGEQS
jgi:hypothetical protein